jgi:hypothetical protein
MPDRIRIGHTIYSWTSCRFQIDGQPWKGVVAMDWEQKRERKVVYDAQPDGRPIGKTAGKYSVSAFTMKMLRDSATALKEYLTATGLGSYGDAEFSITVQTVEPALGLVPTTWVASVCTIDGEKDGHEEGIDELLTEFEIGCLSLKENGLQLWSLTRGLGL